MDSALMQEHASPNPNFPQPNANLESGDSQAQHIAEDTIDGMAAVSDPHSVKSSYFGAFRVVGSAKTKTEYFIQALHQTLHFSSSSRVPQPLFYNG